MAKIREDLVGEVWAQDKNGEQVVLRAGDTVPTGVTVEDDLLDASKAKSSK